MVSPNVSDLMSKSPMLNTSSWHSVITQHAPIDSKSDGYKEMKDSLSIDHKVYQLL